MAVWLFILYLKIGKKWASDRTNLLKIDLYPSLKNLQLLSKLQSHRKIGCNVWWNGPLVLIILCIGTLNFGLWTDNIHHQACDQVITKKQKDATSSVESTVNHWRVPIWVYIAHFTALQALGCDWLLKWCVDFHEWVCICVDASSTFPTIEQNTLINGLQWLGIV